MSKPDYDDPSVEEDWCRQQRANAERYLRTQLDNPGNVGEWPAWHVAPYVAIFAVESVSRPGWIGWWVISGDLPTDYISSSSVSAPQHPRKALRVFADTWLAAVRAWSQGLEADNFDIGDGSRRAELAPLLTGRAELFIKWCADDSMWENG